MSRKRSTRTGVQTIGHEGLVTLARRGGTIVLRWREGTRWAQVTTGSNDEAVARVRARRVDDDLRRVAEILRRSALGLVTIEDAMKHGLAAARGQDPRHQYNQVKAGEKFRAWLKGAHPAVVCWHQLEQVHVFDYIEARLEAKMSPATIKLELNTLRLASNYLAMRDPANYKPLVWRHPRLVSSVHRPKYVEREALLKALDAAVAWRKEEPVAARTAEAAILLCGFAGLRVSEAAVLPVADMNPLTLTVTTGRKTHYSLRTIPVPKWVMERVLEVSAGGPWALARPNAALPMDPINWVTRKTSELLKAAKPTITPRNLRTSFATMAIAVARVESEWLRRYIGHRPQTVLEEHYADYGLVDALRIRVVEPIEEYFKKSAEVRDIGGEGCTDRCTEAQGDA